MTFTRRHFLKGVAGAAAAVGTTRIFGPGTAFGKRKYGNNEIKHVIVLMVENRSFDHFLGWLPGADGMQEGLLYPNREGVLVPTYHLPPDWQGCSHPDPDHSYEGGRVELNGGACDGWLLAGSNDEFSIGYYQRPDLPFLGEAAVNWTVFDRWFASIMASTFPNRLYMHSAVTDRLDNSRTLTTLPTIWDRLAEKGLVGRYYFSDLPQLALWGERYASISRPYFDFLNDCASGELPHVSYVDPRFAGQELGISGDYHPFGDIRAGEWFLAQTYRAIINSPAWRHTVMFVTFDEWGGFFDHVPPPLMPDVAPELEQAGFRVPCIMISPFAPRGHVSHRTYDNTSILKLIEWRWNLRPLSVRDANANNPAEELDFANGLLSAPDFAVPTVVTGPPCAL
jgi:phospholipase C